MFEQKPKDHIHGKQGCPSCKLSKGEKEIKNFLINNNIKFEEQKKLKNCIDKRHLKFDFYLTDHNICIEYDGEQHSRLVKFYGGIEGYNNRQRRDKIKTDYCLDNNIKLIRFNLSNIKNLPLIITDLK